MTARHAGHCMLNRCSALGNAGGPGVLWYLYVHKSLSYTSADWNEYQKYKSFNWRYKKNPQTNKSTDPRVQPKQLQGGGF